MKKIIHWRSFIVGVSIAAGLGLLVHFLSGLGLWLSFAVGIVALLVNGIIAIIEDEAPGGFNNPRPISESQSAKKRH